MRVRLSDKHKVKITGSSDVYPIMREILLRESKIGREKEHFWTVSLNRANKIINIELSALGSISGISLKPMDVFRLAFIKGASSLILVHNHPSGNLNPSKEDIQLTNLFLKIGKFHSVNVLDHLIISELDYYSFADEGLLQQMLNSKEFAIPVLDGYSELAVDQTALEYARKMLERGIQIDDVAEITGLSTDQLGQL